MKNIFKVTFVGEVAIDHGGPRREFFRLFGLECSETYFHGRRKYFDVNAAAVQVIIFVGYDDENKYKMFLCQLQDGVFFRLGQLIAMSVVQGGCGFPFLSCRCYI